jgi:hypothetical protein
MFSHFLYLNHLWSNRENFLSTILGDSYNLKALGIDIAVSLSAGSGTR